MKKPSKLRAIKNSANQKKRSQTTLRDCKPLNLGKVLRPLFRRDDLLGEMLK